MVVTVRYDHLHTVDFGDDLQCNRAAKPSKGHGQRRKDQKSYG